MTFSKLACWLFKLSLHSPYSNMAILSEKWYLEGNGISSILACNRPNTTSKKSDMRNSLLIILVVVALAMIYLSFRLGALPPGLTGVGFIVIAVLFRQPRS